MPKFTEEDPEREVVLETYEEPCAVCREATHYNWAIFPAYVCSPECQDKLSEDFIKALGIQD